MKKTEGMTQGKNNPVIRADFPDPDVIRVGDVYYMLCTTLHFLPGAVILRSYDLVNWEIATYVFDTFEGTEEARMKNERSNYGCGMWQGSFRYHKGKFFVSFAAKETCKTYFYQADSIEGPWKSTCIDFYFHQGSLFFDEDDRVYLIFGSGDIYIREMLPDLSGMKPEGLCRKILTETEDVWLPHEGVHFYKVDGYYYLLTIHWPKTGRRTQMCYSATSLEGDFKGGVALDDDMGFRNCGIAQGSLVQDNDGKWHAMLMQDRGGAGRFPVLMDAELENGKLKISKPSQSVAVQSNRPRYTYEPMYTSDDFSYDIDKAGHCKLKKQWQWNHEPNAEGWEILAEKGLKLTTGKFSTNVSQAVNTLTQRMFGPKSAVEVTLDASDLNDGDFAGLVALQGCYRMIAITRELRRYYLVVIEREATDKNRNATRADYMPGVITERIILNEPVVRLRMEAEFKANTDTVQFLYGEPREGGKMRRLGTSREMFFGLDHFSGVRCGLALFSTNRIGGTAVFKDFKYEYDNK